MTLGSALVLASLVLGALAVIPRAGGETGARGRVHVRPTAWDARRSADIPFGLSMVCVDDYNGR